MNNEQRSAQYRAFIEDYLKNIYQEFKDEPQKSLFEAMEYSLLAGGKRLRPIFAWIFAGCAAVTGRTQPPLQRQLR